MKKYKLKEEVKKYFTEKWLSSPEPDTLKEWGMNGISIEALEEVPQRVELKLQTEEASGDVMLWKEFDFTDQEKDLCEKALNGELLDIDSLNNKEFERWYLNEYEDSIYDNIRKALKQYLKEKK